MQNGNYPKGFDPDETDGFDQETELLNEYEGTERLDKYLPNDRGQYGQTSCGQSSFGGSPNGQTPFGQTPYGQFGQDRFSQPQFSRQQPDRSKQGQIPYGQFGQTPNGQTPFGQSNYGGPQYGRQSNAQSQNAGQNYAGQAYVQSQNAGQNYAGQANVQSARAGIAENAPARFSKSPVVSKILISLVFAIEVVLFFVAVFGYFADYNSGWTILNRGILIVADLLLVLGVFIRSAPPLYGAGLIAVGFHATAEFCGSLTGSLPSSFDEYCGLILMIPAYLLLLISSVHYLSAGKVIKGKAKTVLAVLFTFMFLICFLTEELYHLISSMVKNGTFYHESYLGADWLILVTNLVLPLLIGVATAVFTVKREKRTD